MIPTLPADKRVIIKCEDFQGNMLYYAEDYDETVYQFPDRRVVKIRNEITGREEDGNIRTTMTTRY